MKLSNKDIIWGYLAQFFNIAAGIVVLPAILRMLSPNEVGLNYLMLTISSLVALFDFGFAPQFGRNISYILSGAQELKKEGISEPLSLDDNIVVNYHLLANMIQTARFVYRRLALFVLFFMLTFGTAYIYKATGEFHNVNNSLIIWILFSVSTFFNIYYTYYASLLVGSAKIMEAQKAIVYSKIVYMTLTILFLYFGLGLLGVVIANLVAPFVNRFLSYFWFFTKDLKSKICQYDISDEEKKELFLIIWYNAKKLGLVFIGSYSINKLSLFIAGLFLPLSAIGSYGLMVQLFGVASAVANTHFSMNQPILASLRVKTDFFALIKKFALCMSVFYLLYIVGGITIVFGGNFILKIIHSQTLLPSMAILSFYSVVILLETNHSDFSTMIVIDNDIPFVKASLISGCLIAVLSYIAIAYTNLGIWGLVLPQGVVQAAYNNWKWPAVVCKRLKMKFSNFLRVGAGELFSQIRYCYDRL
ncbi:MAG: polysaccharide biosynthesis protein [Bacteroidales bacterium]|nr:polysaccharide biosynthesis protein [Bacteroidales bacterium]